MALKKLRGLEKWVSKDKEKLTWVWTELRLKGHIHAHYIPPDNNELHSDVISTLNQLVITPEGQEFITSIRAKWSREKYNKNPNNKGLTITLKPALITKLDYLAKNNSRRKTLEALIYTGFNTEQEMRRIRRKEIDEEKERLEKRWPKKPRADIKQFALKHNYEDLKKAYKQQQQKLDALLFENCQYEVLSSTNLNELIFPDKNLEAILHLYKTKKYYDEKNTAVRETLDTDNHHSNPDK